MWLMYGIQLVVSIHVSCEVVLIMKSVKAHITFQNNTKYPILIRDESVNHF